MKRIALLLAVICALGLPSCVKMSSSTTVKNDASATMTFDMGVKMEAIEAIKEQMEALGEMGGEEMEEAQEKFDELEEMFDEKKLSAKLKEMGLEVVSSKAVEEDGWKGMKVSAKCADINKWRETVKKKAEAEDEGGDGPWGQMGMNDVGTMVPTFYKTSNPKVGEVVLIPPLAGDDMELPIDLEELDELGDEELDMIEAQIEMVKGMFSVSDMKMTAKLTLPGPILSTKGCKKSGESTLVFNMSGDDINLEGLKTMFGMKDGVSATFTIPEDCKIKFLEKKEAKKQEATDAAEKKEKKKGGLKIK